MKLSSCAANRRCEEFCAKCRLLDLENLASACCEKLENLVSDVKLTLTPTTEGQCRNMRLPDLKVDDEAETRPRLPRAVV